MADIGCTKSVAGEAWLSNFFARLSELGLQGRMDEDHTMFNGLGGAKRKSTGAWWVPCGICGTNQTMRICSIPGSMPLLISVGQLAEWGTQMDLQANVNNFTKLGVYEVSLPRSDGGHFLIDLCDFDTDPRKDPRYSQFVITDNVCAALLSEEAEEKWCMPMVEDYGYINSVQEAIASGTWRSALSPHDRRVVSHNLVCLSAVTQALRDDDGSTFCWEVFAGAARTTLCVLRGGHVAGAPIDIRANVDLRDPAVRAHFIQLVHRHKPWMITMAFPCTVWSILNRWNYAMGRVQDLEARQRQDREDFLEFVKEVGFIQKRGGRLLVGENPHTSSAFEQKPIEELLADGFVLVKADQCAFGLWGEIGYFRKGTFFLVPKNSSLVVLLNRLCPGVSLEHPHDQVIGGKKATDAGVWPWDLAKTMVTGALWDLAATKASSLREIALKLSRQHAGKTVKLAEADTHYVCRLLLFRRSQCEVFAVHGDSVQAPKSVVRSVTVAIDAEAQIVEFTDVWLQDGENQSSFTKSEDDVILTILISGSEMPPDQYQYCYPAIRKKLKPEPRQRVLGPEDDAPWREPAPSSAPASTPNSSSTPTVSTSELPVPDGTIPTLEVPPTESWARRTRRRIEPEDEVPPLPVDPDDDQPALRPPHWLDYLDGKVVRKAPALHRPRRSGQQPREHRSDIGPKPNGCSDEVWDALERIHSGLGHPSNTSLVRMLARHGCKPEVIEYARQINCSVCAELSGKNIESQSAVRETPRSFGDLVLIDEFFVTLTDSVRIMLLMIMDAASRLAVTVPLLDGSAYNATAAQVVTALERHWLPWANAMKVLRGDPAKSHCSQAVEIFCRRHGATPDISPAEAHNSMSLVERRIAAWKEIFVAVCREMTLTEADTAWSWSSRIDAALNQHLRTSGYSPYHFVFGRDLWVPTSTLRDDSSLSAMSAVLFDDEARRNELMRVAAQTATIRLDSLSALRRAVHSPQLGVYVPTVGDMVYWWRTPSQFSKILARDKGWHGPGLVVYAETSRVLVMWQGGVLQCHPRQLRRWSVDEKDMLMQYNHLVKLSSQQAASKRQLGFRDISTEDAPPEDMPPAEPEGTGPVIFLPAAPASSSGPAPAPVPEAKESGARDAPPVSQPETEQRDMEEDDLPLATVFAPPPGAAPKTKGKQAKVKPSPAPAPRSSSQPPKALSKRWITLRPRSAADPATEPETEQRDDVAEPSSDAAPAPEPASSSSAPAPRTARQPQVSQDDYVPPPPQPVPPAPKGEAFRNRRAELDRLVMPMVKVAPKPKPGPTGEEFRKRRAEVDQLVIPRVLRQSAPTTDAYRRRRAELEASRPPDDERDSPPKVVHRHDPEWLEVSDQTVDLPARTRQKHETFDLTLDDADDEADAGAGTFLSFLASRWLSSAEADFVELEARTSAHDSYFAAAFEAEEELDLKIPSLPPWQHRKVAKGREIPWNRIKDTDWEPLFTKSLAKEWRQWLHYDAVEMLNRPLKPGEEALDMRVMHTDKNETLRGARSYEEIPVEAKSRIVVQGPRDMPGEDEQRDTSSPTLPEDCLHLLFMVCISMGWTVEQGDVEAAFLNGAELLRTLILRAPRTGFPAIEGVSEAVPPGTLFRCKRSVYGLNDAPNLWGQSHAKGMVDNGGVESKLAPRTLFFWFDDNADHGHKLIGIVGTHVDDDLFAGTAWWRSHVLPGIRRTFAYTKWQDGAKPFVHLGRRVTQSPGAIVLDQEEYGLGLKQIEVSKERRAKPKLPATPAEISALRASSGKIAWLLKTRMDISARLCGLQQAVSSATIETMHEHNKLVVQCVRDSWQVLRFVPSPYWHEDFRILAVNDSAFMNCYESIEDLPPGQDPAKIECQQGFVIVAGLVNQSSGKVSPANILLWRSHKGRRKTRSTLGAEAGAMSEGVNAGELVRGVFAEILLGRPLILRPPGWPGCTYEQDIAAVVMVAVTDCRSLYDNLTGIGKRPAEARLLLDIAAIKEFVATIFRWVRTQQMIADPLTKIGAPFHYLLWLMEKAEFMFKEDPAYAKKIENMKAVTKARRGVQWSRRKDQRQGMAELADEMYFNETELTQAERERADHLSGFVEACNARRRLELGLGAESAVRDHWVEDSFMTKISSILGLRRFDPIAARIHPAGRSVMYVPSQTEIFSRSLQTTTRITCDAAGRAHEDSCWYQRKGPEPRVLAAAPSVTVFGKQSLKRSRPRHPKKKAQPSYAAEQVMAQREVALYVTEQEPDAEGEPEDDVQPDVQHGYAASEPACGPEDFESIPSSEEHEVDQGNGLLAATVAIATTALASGASVTIRCCNAAAHADADATAVADAPDGASSSGACASADIWSALPEPVSPPPVPEYDPRTPIRSRVRPCPRDCELGSGGTCRGDCIYDEGHEGLHTCYSCQAEQAQRWRRISLGSRLENANTQPPQASAPPQALLGDGPSGMMSGSESSTPASTPSPARGRARFAPQRCMQDCPHRQGPCVLRCGRVSGHREPHSCWTCHLHGSIHLRSLGGFGDPSTRWSQLQRKQRTDYVTAWAGVPCRNCGKVSKSTTGSNSHYLRMKCASCGTLLSKAIVIWPDDPDEAQRQLRGFVDFVNNRFEAEAANGGRSI